jgi:hypothetical protein
MASTSGKQAGGGCLGLFVLFIAVGLVVMAIISLAALIDPFDWMPTAHDIWKDCSGDCALAHRFPGFWWHTVANLLYGGVAVAAAAAFFAAVRDVRRTRVARLDSAADAAAFAAAHVQCLGAGAALGGLAVIPIVVAVL